MRPDSHRWVTGDQVGVAFPADPEGWTVPHVLDLDGDGVPLRLFGLAFPSLVGSSEGGAQAWSEFLDPFLHPYIR